VYKTWNIIKSDKKKLVNLVITNFIILEVNIRSVCVCIYINFTNITNKILLYDDRSAEVILQIKYFFSQIGMYLDFNIFF
jgi:hypothetical protein